jgi:hypothetical protein
MKTLKKGDIFPNLMGLFEKGAIFSLENYKFLKI